MRERPVGTARPNRHDPPANTTTNVFEAEREFFAIGLMSIAHTKKIVHWRCNVRNDCEALDEQELRIKAIVQ
jgi:hypothetical protein